MANTITALTVNSKEVTLLYKTVANLIEDTLSRTYELQ